MNEGTNGLTTAIITRKEKLPTLLEGDFFHSRQLFETYANTPRQKPYMVVCTDERGQVVSQLLAVVRYRTSLLPPFFFMHCRVMGEGVYRTEGTSDPPRPSVHRDELFNAMLTALVNRLKNTTLYIEISHISQKMFAYRHFRQLHFFPVRWQNIHNSLHSHTPEERLSERMLQRIDSAYKKGVTHRTVTTEEDFAAFSRLLRHHHWLKPKRYIPADEFFRQMMHQPNCHMELTCYRQHVVGCSMTIYTRDDAHLWYSAFRRKTFPMIRPDVLTIWHAIKQAHADGRQHVRFLDVGLPTRKNAYREFILSFGGKPVSTFRWFRCSIKWLNRLLQWIYKD
ncbi:MAG: GNAT family N-acetyltransferase [Prevotella sp.]|nr:GNAT family N-acetyltransferase [Prevotella sp.]